MQADRAGVPASRSFGNATSATVVVVCGLAVGLLALCWRISGAPSDWTALAILSILGVTSWVLRETDVGARIQFSFTSIIMMTAAVIVGPVGAGVVGLVSTVIQQRGMKPVVRVFNVGMFTCMATIAALVYLLSGGVVRAQGVHGAVDLIRYVGAPMMLGEIAQCLVNALALAVILRVSTGVPMRMQAWKLLSTSGPAYVGYGIIGFLFVVLWIPARVGWFSAVLVLAPLFVARWAFAQYGDELRAHERTLRALVTAVETKEPQSQGHSERVAQLSEWIAESLGLGHKEIQDVRTAGMLHDVGKVAVPTRLLRSRTTLTDDELVVLADHARAGVDLVKDIGFLAASLEGIAHHHERWDGRGYPAGLAGDRIPPTARIIAVADAFDALTSPRSYRPAESVERALAELSRRGGTHLDPAMVEALERVVARHGWEPTVRSAGVLTAASTARDHDDPEMSDYFAEHPDLREQLRVTAERPSEPRPTTDATRPAADRRTASPTQPTGRDHHVGGRV